MNSDKNDYFAQVYSVKWENGDGLEEKLALVEVRSSRLKHKWIVDRVRLGIDNLISLQPSSHAIQVCELGYVPIFYIKTIYAYKSPSLKKVAGYCFLGNQSYLLTEWCNKYGSLDKFVRSKTFLNLSALQRFSMAIWIVESFVFLHHKSGIPKVHCDLHDTQQVDFKEICKKIAKNKQSRFFLGTGTVSCNKQTTSGS